MFIKKYTVSYRTNLEGGNTGDCIFETETEPTEESIRALYKAGHWGITVIINYYPVEKSVIEMIDYKIDQIKKDNKNVKVSAIILGSNRYKDFKELKYKGDYIQMIDSVRNKVDYYKTFPVYLSLSADKDSIFIAY